MNWPIKLPGFTIPSPTHHHHTTTTTISSLLNFCKLIMKLTLETNSLLCLGSSHCTGHSDRSTYVLPGHTINYIGCSLILMDMMSPACLSIYLSGVWTLFVPMMSLSNLSPVIQYLTHTRDSAGRHFTIRSPFRECYEGTPSQVNLSSQPLIKSFPFGNCSL